MIGKVLNLKVYIAILKVFLVPGLSFYSLADSMMLYKTDVLVV